VCCKKLIAPIHLLVKLHSHIAQLVLEHLAFSLQILDFISQLVKVLLEMNSVFGQELPPDLLYNFLVRLFFH